MVPAMHSRSYPRFKITSWERGAVVARLLVELLGVAEDVGRVDLLGPIACADLLQGDRHRLFAITQHLSYISDDGCSEPDLLGLGFPGPELDDDMRHDSLLGLARADCFNPCWMWFRIAHPLLVRASPRPSH